jgi:hypothetical protein
MSVVLKVKAVFAKPVMGRKVAAGYHWQLATRFFRTFSVT